MKNLVKLVTINDGNEKEHQNGNWLYIESRPRAEKIIAAFLDDGWQIADFVKRYNPTIPQEGSFNFHIGGLELLFTKTVEDDAEDNGDTILDRVLHELGCAKKRRIADDELDDTGLIDPDEDEESDG